MSVRATASILLFFLAYAAAIALTRASITPFTRQTPLGGEYIASAKDTVGNIYAVSVVSPGFGGALTRIDRFGNVLWTVVIPDFNFEPVDVAVDPTGNPIVACGREFSVAKIFKFDALGVQQKEFSIGANQVLLESIAVDTLGNCIVLALIESSGERSYVAKLDSNLAPVWENFGTGDDDIFTDMSIGTDGNIETAGFRNNGTSVDGVIALYASLNGSKFRFPFHTDNASTVFEKAVRFPNGFMYAAGVFRASVNASTGKGIVARVDQNQIRTSKLTTSSGYRHVGALNTDFNTLFVASDQKALSAFPQDLSTVKFETVQPCDEIRDLLIDNANSRVVVVGDFFQTGLFARAVSKADGTTQAWASTFAMPDPFGSRTTLSSSLQDINGNPTTFATVGNRLVVRKLRLGTGTPLFAFEAGLFGQASINTSGAAIDSAGNCYTLFSIGSRRGTNAVVKVDRLGNTVWATSLAASGTSEDSLQDIAIGPDGNPVVCGTSRDGANFNSDMLIAKLDAATGARIWQTAFDMAGGGDFAQAIAIAPSGNVYVTGIAAFTAGRGDVVLLRILGANGGVTWTRIYNSDNDGDDRGTDVVVAPNGNICEIGELDGHTGVALCYSPAGFLLWEHFVPNASEDDFVDAVQVEAGPDNVIWAAFGHSFGVNPRGIFNKYDLNAGTQLLSVTNENPLRHFELNSVGNPVTLEVFGKAFLLNKNTGNTIAQASLVAGNFTLDAANNAYFIINQFPMRLRKTNSTFATLAEADIADAHTTFQKVLRGKDNDIWVPGQSQLEGDAVRFKQP